MATTSNHKPTAQPPKLHHVLETCLYVRSVPKAAEFYQRVFEVKPDFVADRMAALPVGNTMLLLFGLGLTAEDGVDERLGTVPGHGPSPKILELLSSGEQEGDRQSTGQQRQRLGQHFCFAAATMEDVDAWHARLKELDVKILSVRDWAQGGRSVYFEDLDGHIGEVGSRGIWKHW